jgi:hypothetical protein
MPKKHIKDRAGRLRFCGEAMWMMKSLTVGHLVQVVLRKSRHGGCKSEVESGMGSNGSICSAFSVPHYRSKKQESYASSTCTVCMSKK